MDFVIFRRADSALLVVPALFQPPIACTLGGPMQRLGHCDLEIERFSPRVAAQLAEAGFALVTDDDLDVVRIALLAAADEPGEAIR